MNDSLVTLLLALLAMLGAGGGGVILRDVWMRWRSEGVEHTPGEVVFDRQESVIDRQDRVIIALQQQTAAQSQQIATLGETVRSMQEAAITRERRMGEVEAELLRTKHEHDTERKALQAQLAEAEFALSEEQAKTRLLEARVAHLEAELAKVQGRQDRQETP